MITDSLPKSSIGARRLVAGVIVLCALSGIGGWALAERGERAADDPVTGTIVDLSGNASKVCVAVDGENQCGALVVPPGSTTPLMGQRVQVYIRDINGTEFLFIPPTVG